MSNIKKEIEAFFSEGATEVQRHLSELGKAAVILNRTEGDYRNQTGHLRQSNYYEASIDRLTLGNKAEYASQVESRGYNVIDSGVKYIIEEVNDNNSKGG